MPKSILLAVLSLLMCASTAWAQTPEPDTGTPPMPDGEIEWVPFEQALSSAETNDEKVLVFVYTQWCGWCRKMLETVFTDEEVNTYMNDAFATVRLDAEGTTPVKLEAKSQDGTPLDNVTEAQLATALGAQGFPTTIFMESDGQYITRLPSYLPAENYIQVLRYIGENHFQTQSFEEYLAGLQEGEDVDNG